MQKTLVILICALFFGAPATSKASPLDSPDIVYIDGQPCNSACQSYMAWSRQIMPVRGQPPRVRAKAVAHQQPPNAAARRATRIRDAGSKPAANDRLAKQAVPTSTEMPQARRPPAPILRVQRLQIRFPRLVRLLIPAREPQLSR
jgi:hypothetical protein